MKKALNRISKERVNLGRNWGCSQTKMGSIYKEFEINPYHEIEVVFNYCSFIEKSFER